ncbi:VOC family protein [Chitinophaga defluvii]|uniref:VOC family protein n=1 Tax=Chitinophaga defluvii TaxID=3163343 RepID=A0ABV2TBY6_9BACT
MASVNPYLNFNDTCEAAFNHYKSVFGGEFLTISRFSDSPAEYQGAPEEANKIMHVALPIGNNTILMGSDCPASWGRVSQGNSLSIAYNPDSEAAAKKAFEGLAAGGKVTMPLEKTFWGAYFGMVIDQFGVNWMINYTYEQPK